MLPSTTGKPTSQALISQSQSLTMALRHPDLHWRGDVGDEASSERTSGRMVRQVTQVPGQQIIECILSVRLQCHCAILSIDVHHVLMHAYGWRQFNPREIHMNVTVCMSLCYCVSLCYCMSLSECIGIANNYKLIIDRQQTKATNACFAHLDLLHPDVDSHVNEPAGEVIVARMSFEISLRHGQSKF